MTTSGKYGATETEPQSEPNIEEMNLLMSLLSEGRYGEVELLTRSWTARLPQYGIGWKALGTAISLQGRNGDALAPMQQAAVLLPDDAETQFNLGVIFGSLGRLEEEEFCYRRALEISPEYPAAHNNRGTVLKDLGRLEEAEVSYRQALRITPEWAEVHNNLGTVLNELGRPGDAVDSYRRAVQLNPEAAEAYSNLGALLRDCGELEEAESSIRRALQIRPDYADAYNNLGAINKDLGRLQDAEIAFRRALELKADYTDAYSNLLFTMNYLVNRSSESRLEAAIDYGRKVASRAGQIYSAWRCTPDPARLKVGIVSGDLNQHPVGYFLDGLLGEIDRKRVELVAFPTHRKSDELTDRLRKHFSAWTPLFDLNDDAAARCIEGEGVHVLLDLSGHSAHNRLPVFARKPAPIQATWMGYLATTGLKAMDYLIADAWTLPVSEEAHFTEQIWRLPESYLCFTPPGLAIPVSPLPALTNGSITFGSLNNLTKVGDQVIALWARVLASVPGSRLLLKSKQLQAASIRQQTRARFAVRGIGAEQLILEGPVTDKAEHLAAYQRIDIALDPFPYPGITTTVESLWMGVPVLTLAGERFMSRQGVGLLTNAGLPEWIATDGDDYLSRACAYASDLGRLAKLRQDLRQQVMNSPSFDAEKFARRFEAALWGMWNRRQALR